MEPDETILAEQLLLYLGFDPKKTISLVVEIKPQDQKIYYRHEGVL